MIKLIAMLIAYKWAAKETRALIKEVGRRGPYELYFQEVYERMYHTLMKPIGGKE